jgi:hypothetical protein
MLTRRAVGVQWDRVIVLREQARSHRGFVNDTDQLWERACSRWGQHSHHTSSHISLTYEQ